MGILGVALIAAACMVVTDVVGTIMVQAEAANRGWLAGLMDMVGWLFSIQSTSVSVAAVNGSSLSKHIIVLTFVSAANLFGTKLGQVTGKYLLHRFPSKDNYEAKERRRVTVGERA